MKIQDLLTKKVQIIKETERTVYSFSDTTNRIEFCLTQRFNKKSSFRYSSFCWHSAEHYL